MIPTSEFKKGLEIELDGEPFVIVDFLHVNPGRGGAFIRTKLRNLVTGNILERTFRSGEKMNSPDLEERGMQFLYREEDQFHFMDNETYEQFQLTTDQLGENQYFLKENGNLAILFHNRKPIGAKLPFFVELKIIKTDPGLKGDPASGSTKPAVLETGATIQVPLFLNEGEVVKVNTRTREYVERVK